MRVFLGLFVVTASIFLAGCATADNTNTLGTGAANRSTNATNSPGAMVNDNTTTSNAATVSQSGNSSPADSDKRFIASAAQGGKADVEMGRLASQKAHSPAVKQFGQQMVEDHTSANNDLKALAAQKGWTLPADVSSEQESTMNRLSKLSGAAFDKAYAEDMVKDHEQDVKEFEEESSSAKNNDLKAFASKTLPVLQRHLKMAKAMSSAVKP